jgi:hypothetical protein
LYIVLVEDVIEVIVRNLYIRNGEEVGKIGITSIQEFGKKSRVGSEEVDHIGITVDKGQKGKVVSRGIEGCCCGIGRLIVILVIKHIGKTAIVIEVIIIHIKEVVLVKEITKV